MFSASLSFQNFKQSYEDQLLVYYEGGTWQATPQFVATVRSLIFEKDQNQTNTVVNHFQQINDAFESFLQESVAICEQNIQNLNKILENLTNNSSNNQNSKSKNKKSQKTQNYQASANAIDQSYTIQLLTEFLQNQKNQYQTQLNLHNTMLQKISNIKTSFELHNNIENNVKQIWVDKTNQPIEIQDTKQFYQTLVEHLNNVNMEFYIKYNMFQKQVDEQLQIHLNINKK